MLVPAPDPVLLSMIDHGKRDARTWAAATGLEAYVAGTLFVPREPEAPATAADPHLASPRHHGRAHTHCNAGPSSPHPRGTAGRPHHHHHRRGKRELHVDVGGSSDEEEEAFHDVAPPSSGPQQQRGAEVVVTSLGLGLRHSVGEEAWDAEANAFTTRITFAPGEGAGRHAEGLEVGAQNSARSVTVRVKGRDGAPDTLITLDLPRN